MNIILDKSYLIGASRKLISNLFCQYQLMMPETLFLEILTSDDKSQIKKCFSKFPKKENPIALLPSSGNLIYYEKVNHSPSTPLQNRVLDIKYKFNSDLCCDKYERIIENVEESLDEWIKFTAERADGFAKKAETVPDWFPELKNKTCISKEMINEAMQKIGNDTNFVRDVYTIIQKEIFKNGREEWPTADKIDKNWALFRYIQFHLIGTLDFFIRRI
jgi:hypothetical protein